MITEIIESCDKFGEWVDINDIPLALKGFACGCVCPKCGEEVGAWIDFTEKDNRKTPIKHFKLFPKNPDFSLKILKNP